MTNIEPTVEEMDDIAQVVVDRLRRAQRYRDGYIAHQGVGFTSLIKRAESQYRREYTADDATAMAKAFGFVPTRYYGIVQQKTNATVAWNNDLIVNNLDSMFTVNPSPVPELDQESLDNIREGVRNELRKRMQTAGIADPRLLLDAAGNPAKRIKYFLQDQVRALKQIEQARIVSLAGQSAKTIQTSMRDTSLDGTYRQEYSKYTFERVLKGMGVMKWPDWQYRLVPVHEGRKVRMVQKIMPMFRHVPLLDFYPIADGPDCQTNSGNTEVTRITKAELIGLGKQKEYRLSEITWILENFSYRSRDWLTPTSATQEAAWWELDEQIDLLLHEGYFSGDELRKYGISGLHSTDYVTAKIAVCGGRTILCKLLPPTATGAARTYFAAPFNKCGDNLFDALGIGPMLWDSEQRVNRLLHIFEHNVDWASRPPLLSNPSVFENPGDARIITPGETYTVEDRYASSASMPEPVRPMGTVSAQYHLIMTQVGQVLRQADEDCGIPSFAYSAQDFGRSSLGEYSQRMSNALRTIKESSLKEDLYFIEPVFKSMFQWKMQSDPKLADGQDVQCVIRGMTGLLQADLQAQRQTALLPTLLNPALVNANLVPPIALQYAVRNLLEQAGFPVDALGLTDPQIDHAIAVATATPTPGMIPGGQQVPQLDGRSAVPAQNVASPSGQSQLAIPSPGFSPT